MMTDLSPSTLHQPDELTALHQRVAELERQLAAGPTLIEAQLRASEERLRQTVESISEIIYRLTFADDPPGEVMEFVSGQVETLLGYRPEEFLGNPARWAQLIHPADLPLVVEAMHQIRASRRAGVREYRIRHKHTGAYHWFEDHVTPLFDAQGRLIAQQGAARDITERKHAEAQLRYQAQLLANAHDAIVASDANYIVTAWNAAAEMMYGWKAEEIIGQNGSEKLREQSSAAERERVLHSMATTGRYRGEMTHLRKDGTRFPVEVALIVFRDEQGQVTGYASVNRDITERKQAEAALRESEARYRNLVEQMVDGIFVTDQTGRCLDANPAGIQMLGYTLAELRTMTASDVMAPIYVSRVSAEIANLSVGDIVVSEWQFRRQDGSTFAGEVAGRQLPDGRLLAIVRDISERKRAEAAEHEHRSLAEALRDTATALNSTLNLEEVLDRILANVGRVVPHDAADILLVEGHLARPMRARGFVERGAEVWLLSQRFPIEATRHLHLMAQTRQATLLADTHTSPHWAVSAEGQWIHSFVGAPIMSKERTLGFLQLFSPTPNFFTPQNAEHLQAFADQAALALENARLFEEAHRQTSDFRALTLTSAALRHAPTREAMFPVLVEQTMQAVRAEAGALILHERAQLVFAAARGPAEALVGQRRTTAEDPLWAVMQARQSLFITDAESLSTWARYADGRILVEGFAACALLPLQTATASVGLLYVAFRAPRRFAEQDIRLLEALAEIAGNALQRAGVMETLEQRVQDRTRELALLYDVASMANQALDVGHLLNWALDQAVSAVLGEAGAIHLLEPNSAALRLAASYALNPAAVVQRGEQLADDRLAAQVVHRHEPLVLQLLADDRAGPRACVSVPLRARGRGLGALTLIGRAGQTFDSNTVSLLTSMAGPIAGAIDNAHLRQQAEQARVREERERLALELHDSVTQLLYSVTLLAEAGRREAKAGAAALAEGYLTQLGDNAQQALKEMRLLIYELRPAALEQAGLVAALQHRLDAVEERARVKTRLLVERAAELPTALESDLYGIVHEALNNALKHSRATEVTVRVVVDEAHVMVEIEDNGQGFEVGRVASGGVGLVSMGERAKRCGGTLTLDSVPGGGTRVQILIEHKELG